MGNSVTRLHTCHDAVRSLISRIMIPVHLCQFACVPRGINNHRCVDDQIVQARKLGAIIVVNTVLGSAEVKFHTHL